MLNWILNIIFGSTSFDVAQPVQFHQPWKQMVEAPHLEGVHAASCCRCATCMLSFHKHPFVCIKVRRSWITDLCFILAFILGGFHWSFVSTDSSFFCSGFQASRHQHTLNTDYLWVKPMCLKLLEKTFIRAQEMKRDDDTCCCRAGNLTPLFLSCCCWMLKLVWAHKACWCHHPVRVTTYVNAGQFWYVEPVLL